MKRAIIYLSFLTFLTTVSSSACTSIQGISDYPPDYSDTYSVVIFDDWSGLSPSAPEIALYTIEEIGNQYEGSALFDVGGYSTNPQKTSTALLVPNDVVQSFLKKLSEAELENGKYVPNRQWTDDYPEIAIRVTYGESETIEFYTSSQGEEHIPWQVTYKGKSYIVNSGIPAQALEMLKPYLAQDTFQKLKDTVSD